MSINVYQTTFKFSKYNKKRGKNIHFRFMVVANHLIYLKKCGISLNTTYWFHFE